MEKLKLESPDFTQQNIARIAELFPSAITETKDADGKLKRAINFTTLKQLLSDEVVDGEECYEFTWVGKKQSIIEGNRPIRKTLRPVKDESKNWDTTENLYIEGDNLEVLKLLQNSYLNSIKMIYIDPPYNTGNDFVYRDDFAVSREEYEGEMGMYDEDENRLFKNTETNGRFHSDWCSMMYPRLQLARNLLSDDGVIFISIDDNELDNLRKICDEVFGEENFRNIFSIRRYDKNLNRQFMEGGLKSYNVGFEYILCYSKLNDFLFNPIFREASEERQTKGYWKGFWNDADRPTMRYDILGFTPTSGQWKWSKEVALVAVENYKIYLEKHSNEKSLEEYFEETGRKLKFIRRNPNGTGKNLGVENWIAPSDGILRNTNWTDLLASKNEEVAQGLFDFPKNRDVIELVINASCKKNSIILDFFSGSATTAHAIMQLNAEDGGNRKFIMVQLPETTDEKSEAYKAGYSTICEIGKERIRRAGKKIEEELKPKSTKGELFDNEEEVKTVDTGFRVLKLDDTNMKDVYYSAGDYSQQMLLNLESNIKEDRTDLDLLYGVLLDWGVSLSLPHITETVGGKKVHFVNETDLVACFEEDVNEAVVREIAKRKPLRVVFRDSSFGSSPEKINVSEIFKTLSPDTTIKVI